MIQAGKEQVFRGTGSALHGKFFTLPKTLFPVIWIHSERIVPSFILCVRSLPNCSVILLMSMVQSIIIYMES